MGKDSLTLNLSNVLVTSDLIPKSVKGKFAFQDIIAFDNGEQVNIDGNTVGKIFNRALKNFSNGSEKSFSLENFLENIKNVLDTNPDLLKSSKEKKILVEAEILSQLFSGVVNPNEIRLVPLGEDKIKLDLISPQKEEPDLTSETVNEIKKLPKEMKIESGSAGKEFLITIEPQEVEENSQTEIVTGSKKAVIESFQEQEGKKNFFENSALKTVSSVSKDVNDVLRNSGNEKFGAEIPVAKNTPEVQNVEYEKVAESGVSKNIASMKSVDDAKSNYPEVEELNTAKGKVKVSNNNEKTEKAKNDFTLSGKNLKVETEAQAEVNITGKTVDENNSPGKVVPDFTDEAKPGVAEGIVENIENKETKFTANDLKVEKPSGLTKENVSVSGKEKILQSNLPKINPKVSSQKIKAGSNSTNQNFDANGLLGKSENEVKINKELKNNLESEFLAKNINEIKISHGKDNIEAKSKINRAISTEDKIKDVVSMRKDFSPVENGKKILYKINIKPIKDELHFVFHNKRKLEVSQTNRKGEKSNVGNSKPAESSSPAFIKKSVEIPEFGNAFVRTAEAKRKLRKASKVKKAKEVLTEDVKTEKENVIIKHGQGFGKPAEVREKVLSKFSSEINAVTDFNKGTKGISQHGKFKFEGELKNALLKTIDVKNTISELTKFFVNGGKQTAVLKLHPKELGEIKISMEVIKNVVNAHIEVQNENVRQLIQANLQILRENLAQQGLALNNFNINYSNGKKEEYGNKSGRRKTVVKSSEQDETLHEVEKYQFKNLGYNQFDFIA